MQEIYQLDPEQIKRIPWNNSVEDYDTALFELGPKDEIFVGINPWLKDSRPFYFIEEIPDEDRCIVYTHNGEWVAKFFPVDWNFSKGYLTLEIEIPKMVWRKNPDLDRTMTFDNDPINIFEPDPYQSKCELVWYIDKRFAPLKDRVWAYTCRPLKGHIVEVKDMGDICPSVEIEFNQDLPDINYDINRILPAFWECHDENVYLLDPRHTPHHEIWAVRIRPTYRKPSDWVVKGYVTPKFRIDYNPDLPKLLIDLDYQIPWHDLQYCHVWYLDKQFTPDLEEPIWLVKISAAGKTAAEKYMGEISPRLVLEYNPDLPPMDYDLTYMVKHYDLGYEHFWYLDRKFCGNIDYEIWVIRARYTDYVTGTKTIGYLSPKPRITFNPNLPKLKVELDLDVPYYDFGFEHLFMLNKKFTDNVGKDIWLAKVRYTKKTQGTKVAGPVTPIPSVIYNEICQGLEFKDIDLVVPYYDLVYTHSYMLDAEYCGEDGIEAMRIDYTKNPKGYKTKGIRVPHTKLQLNRSIKNLCIEWDYQIPYYDRTYLHEWYVKNNDEKIWAVRAKLDDNATQVKDMGYIDLDLATRLDVVFISYHEPDADLHWRRVKSKAPWAKRVNGVDGIFEAHRAAAQIAETDMFYVVDGDAWLVDDWNFDFSPDLFDRQYVYIWVSANPFNDLNYGYGGVKLFPRQAMLKMHKWTSLDLSTTIGAGVKVMNKISNVTKFNVDEFSTWRSAFRETVKLCQNNEKKKLASWVSKDSSFKLYAILGIEQGREFFKKHKNNMSMLIKINDRAWLEKTFKELVNE